MSGTSIKEQVLKHEMLLLLSWCSYHLENYMGFKNSVPGTRDRDQYIYFLSFHNLQCVFYELYTLACECYNLVQN